MMSGKRLLTRLQVLRQQMLNAKNISQASASLIQNDPTEVLFEKVNSQGVITLNRVPAHHAVNHNMTVRIGKQLKVWEEDDSISLVIIKGAGTKAFSAGGDVRELIDTAQKDHKAEISYQFLRDEYSTQMKIGSYRKPYVAFIGGYCMGGGCGLAVNGRYRVASEDTVLSMPEAAIGFYPDNGGSHFLSHLPGYLGMYLGLTCTQLKGEDAFTVGLATHYATKSDGSLQNLQEELFSLQQPSNEQVIKILDKYNQKCCSGKPLSLETDLSSINRVFGLDNVEEIMQCLREDNSKWAQDALRAMLKNSPTSLKVVHRMLRKAKALDLRQCLAMELTVGRSILQNPHSDFFQGVKALLVDKSARAQWQPRSLEEVTKGIVDSHFVSMSQLGLKEFTPI